MFAPLLATMQAEGVLNRVARFVAEQPQAIGPVATLDLEDLRALEALEPGVREIEGDRDAWDAVGREPFLGEPAVGAHAQISRPEFLVESLDRTLEPGSFELEAQVTESPFEEFVVRTGFPGSGARHEPESIPGPRLANEFFAVPGWPDDVVYDDRVAAHPRSPAKRCAPWTRGVDAC